MTRNRLSEETSPYLLQHADNPVHWYGWGPEAIAAAKAQDKPILLSVATLPVTGAMSWLMKASRTTPSRRR